MKSAPTSVPFSMTRNLDKDEKDTHIVRTP
ncbi:UNVERIFIED_CONTAM: hypothetical protein ABIC26_003757 [Paenibacillus sp. PvR008]